MIADNSRPSNTIGQHAGQYAGIPLGKAELVQLLRCAPNDVILASTQRSGADYDQA